MTDGTNAQLAQEGPADHAPEGWQPGAGARLVFNAMLIAIGVTYLVLAFQLPTFNAAGPAAGFFPVVGVALFLVCMAISTATTLRSLTHGQPAKGTGRVSRKVLVILSAILAYLLLVGIIGHLITSLLITTVLLRVLGKRRWWQIVLAAGLAAVVSDLLFTVMLGLRLPTGLFGIGFAAWI